MIGLSTSYVVEFDIASIILTIMLLYTLLIRNSFPTEAINQYKYLLFCNLISSTADFFSAYTICNASVVPQSLNYFISMVFVLFHNITGVFFMLYIIAAIRGNLGTKHECILWRSMLSVITVLVLTTSYTKAVFYFDNNNVYHHGPLFFVLYIVVGISVIYSSYLILTHRSSMSLFQMGSNFTFIFMIVFSVIFQAFFPNCLLENFIIAIACLMMNAALDNPAAYFYQNTGCYNQSAFDKKMEYELTHNNSFVLAAFTYDDLSVFRKQYSEKDYEALILTTIQRCQKIAGRRKVFILQDFTFVILQEKGDAEHLIETIEASVKCPFRLTNGSETAVDPHFCLLQFPGEAKTVNEINLVIQDMLTHIYRKTGQQVIRDSTDLLEDLHHEDDVVHLLHSALRNDGITVLFQPIRNRKTKLFSGAEALVRLRDTSISVYPDEFIPIAEKNGLILSIGEVVLEQVCRFLEESHCDEFGIEQINVNLSMLQLVNKSAVDRLVNICCNHRVAPQRIVFEITETATEGNGAETVFENIRYLKEMGFSLSLDDYGCGYSNITNLLRFPFDQIKIDKTLLWSAVHSNNSMTVLENLIQLVQNFGKNCVVEGVEDESMENIVDRLGVDYFQGYMYSRPISAVSLLAFLKENNSI